MAPQAAFPQAPGISQPQAPVAAPQMAPQAAFPQAPGIAQPAAPSGMASLFAPPPAPPQVQSPQQPYGQFASIQPPVQAAGQPQVPAAPAPSPFQAFAPAPAAPAPVALAPVQEAAPVAAPVAQRVTSDGGQLAVVGNFQVLCLPARKESQRITVRIESDVKAPAGLKPLTPPNDLAALIRGAAPQWAVGLPAANGPKIIGDGIEADTLGFPATAINPWQTQWRLGGLDYFADGKRMAVCTWMGDVWLVDTTLKGSDYLRVV